MVTVWCAMEPNRHVKSTREEASVKNHMRKWGNRYKFKRIYAARVARNLWPVDVMETPMEREDIRPCKFDYTRCVCVYLASDSARGIELN